jgi:hypothetical protein
MKSKTRKLRRWIKLNTELDKFNYIRSVTRRGRDKVLPPRDRRKAE